MANEPSRIRETVDVDVPLSTAYNQWTQFETFPQFMEGVEEVRQLDERNLHWKAEIAGKAVEWNARIIEQVPDRRVAWRSTSGASNAGTVSFERLSPESTRVELQLEYEPEGFTQNVGDFLGVVGRRAKGDLKRFKEFIETRGQESGAWRGRVPGPGGPSAL